MGTKVICVEGLDGSGKTTLVNTLDNVLCERELNVKIISPFDICSYGRTFKSDILNTKNHFLELTGMSHMLGRFQIALAKMITESKYDVIILDRYLPSFFTYQIHGKETNKELSTILLTELLKHPVKVHKHYLVEASKESTINRLTGKRLEDDGDARSLSIYDELIEGYRTFYKAYEVDVNILPSDHLDDISKNVSRVAAGLFEWRSKSALAVNTIC